MKVAGSNLHINFFVTPRWLLVQHSVVTLIIYNGLWLSGLSCLFLLQNYCMVVGSNPVDGSILYTQIRNHPTPLLYHVY